MLYVRAVLYVYAVSLDPIWEVLHESAWLGPMICSACGAAIGDNSRFCPMCGAPMQAGRGFRETRKNVSVLFVDIVGSTALAERLDPEPLRLLLDRYFAACMAAIKGYGGALEKFIGDAVMAVFGADVTHEDDAVRAVRAAAGVLAALDDLNADATPSHGVRLEVRCGLCSGEVMVTMAPGGDFRVVGDAVNTASRLQTAAQPGEILIDAQTAAMVTGHIGIQAIPRLRLKGKASTVPAWRVTDPFLDEAENAVSPSAPLIGRADELEELRRSLRRVAEHSQPCLVTVLGAAGIGKTRLVREFLKELTDGAATVMSGRCSAYGRGITYAPLADMLCDLPGGWAGLSARLSGDPADSELGARAIHGLEAIITPDNGEQAGVEEISWAARYVIGMLGKERPVIMIWDDLQWAGETLLDLIDDAATWIIDVPVLLLCIARTELLETRPAWGGGKPCASTLELGPLTLEQSAMLVGELASQDVHAHDHQDPYGRVAAECDGNPLFAELMLDVSAETAPQAQVPPTIRALLAARLDQLPDDERQVVEMAAVIGREFTEDTLLAMATEEGRGDIATADLITRLARHRIVHRVDRALRFRQTLLRDTAYTLTPKAHRERRHMFLAGQLAEQALTAAQPSGRDDALVFAYHVEAAWRLHRELVPGDSRLPELASAAADVLIDEGKRALQRKDLPAGAALLERGRGLLAPDDARRLPLALHISDCWLGMWDGNRSIAALSVEESAAGADRRAHATCAIQRSIVALRFGMATPERVAVDAERIEMDLHEAAGDDLSWCRYQQLQAYLNLARGRAGEADASLQLALERARAMRDRYEEDRLLCAICEVAQWTPSHLDEGLELCATLARRFAANRALLVPVLVTRAHLTALAGRIEDARETLRTARAYADALHLDLADAAVLEMSGIVESLAGAHHTAEMHFRRAATVLRAAPHAPDADTADAATARELFSQGRMAETTAALDGLTQQTTNLSLSARIAATSLHGLVASAQGRHEEAIALVTQAHELSESVDDPCLAGDLLFDLAVVQRAAGLNHRGAGAAARALERYATKGASLLVSRVQEWIDEVE